MGRLLRFLREVLRVLVWPWLQWRRTVAAPKGSYLRLDLRGNVVPLSRPQRRPWDRWLQRPRPVVDLRHLQEIFQEAAADPRVPGVVLVFRQLRLGMASASTLREALLRARAAGLQVVVYLPDGADTRQLHVASAASRVLVGPRTSVAPLGFAASFRYLRLVFDRLGVVPEVYARGRYKSAGESVARDAMSEAQKEQTNALLDRNYAAFVDGMSEGRGLAKDVVAQLVDGAPYSALEAKAHRLVDDVAYEDEVPERLGPEGVEVPLRAVGNYLARRTATQRRPVREPDVIGVIGIEGTIAQDASTWPRAGTVTDTAAIAALRRARRQRHVKGVVVYIDSPGGSALASDRIHREVQLLAREKPVAVCMGNVAASGGYYVAAAAPYIVANPLTVTGSIGVISARFAVAPLLERFGIRLETLQRGERASLLDSLQPYSERERKVVEREIEHIYGGFLSVVAEGRGRRVEEVAPLAEGRVWSGADAFDRGLVDKLGGFDDALAYVRERLPEGLGPLEPVWVMGTTKEEPLAAKAKRSANIPDVLGAGLGIFAGCTEEFAATLSLLLRERVLMLSCDVHDPFDD